MARLEFVAIVAILLVAGVSAAGRFSEVDVKDAEVQEIAQFAVARASEKAQAPVVLSEVEYAERKLVNGWLYRVQVLVAEQNRHMQLHRATGTVHKSFKGEMELQESALVQEDDECLVCRNQCRSKWAGEAQFMRMKCEADCKKSEACTETPVTISVVAAEPADEEEEMSPEEECRACKQACKKDWPTEKVKQCVNRCKAWSACRKSEEEEEAPVLGGGARSPIDPESEEVQAAAKWYIAYASAADGIEHELKTVTEAKKQIVSGYSYYLTVVMEGSDGSTRTREITVWLGPDFKTYTLMKENETSVVKNSPVLGGGARSPIDPESEEVQAAAKWYIAYASAADGIEHELKTVTEAKKQIVSGYSYYLTVVMEGSDGSTRTREITVWLGPDFKTYTLMKENETSVVQAFAAPSPYSSACDKCKYSCEVVSGLDTPAYNQCVKMCGVCKERLSVDAADVKDAAELFVDTLNSANLVLVSTEEMVLTTVKEITSAEGMQTSEGYYYDIKLTIQSSDKMERDVEISVLKGTEGTANLVEVNEVDDRSVQAEVAAASAAPSTAPKAGSFNYAALLGGLAGALVVVAGVAVFALVVMRRARENREESSGYADYRESLV